MDRTLNFVKLLWILYVKHNKTFEMDGGQKIYLHIFFLTFCDNFAFFLIKNPCVTEISKDSKFTLPLHISGPNKY